MAVIGSLVPEYYCGIVYISAIPPQKKNNQNVHKSGTGEINCEVRT